MRVFTHFKFIKILLLKCVRVKIKTKANSGLKKNRTKGERYHEKKKVITLIVAALIEQDGDENCLTRLMDAVTVTSEYKYFNIIEP